MKTIAALALIAGLVACGPGASPSAPASSSAPSPAGGVTHTLTGAFTLYQDEKVVRTDEHCSGTGGYDDIIDGLDVVVRDDADRIIAAGELVYNPSGGLVSTRCQFEFTIPDVPARTFYSIEVGDRGSLTFSAEDLEASDWTVDMQVGR